MCGIIGYTGKEQAAPKLLLGLKRLEYRGYDSAGIAVFSDGKFSVCKRKGRVSELGGAEKLRGGCGIGHTRWATHGAPSERNAHPHSFGRFVLVHNGIIENYLPLKEECEARGEKFISETDSEVIAHLLEYYDRGDVLSAIKETVARLKGSYALAVMCRDEPNVLYAARRKSPLIVGKGEEGLYLASDVPAIAECRELYSLCDGEFAVLQGDNIRFYGEEGEIKKETMKLVSKSDIPEKGAYPHFMLKEMHEIPAAIANSLINFEDDFCFSGINIVLCQTEYIQIIACGTAYHSGIAAKYAIEALARVPVEVTVASEYRYRDPIVKKGTLALAVSQSGETADTLAAAELAKEKGATVIAITNAPDSSITQIAHFVLFTRAGREIAVAATKSFNAQLALLFSLATALAKTKGRQTPSLRPLPALAEEVLTEAEKMKEIAPILLGAKSVYFIGRGADYCTALEGSLKLKEISYLPSEGYPAGELKHGTLALIDEGTPVIAVLTQEGLAEKTMNAVFEVYARGGRVILVTNLPEYAARKEVYRSILLPKCEELFSPILSVIPLQALAYYTSLARGNDPDKPRNLAKSVTVE